MLVPSTLQTKKVDDSVNNTNWINLRQVYEKVARVINGKLSLGQVSSSQPVGTTVPCDNVDAVSIVANVNVAADTDFPLTHNLGRLPTAYLVTGASMPYQIYNGVTPNTATLIYLRTHIAFNSTIKVMVW